ncbi:MAG TPA: 6-carboxytetrahydropterin synthase [Sedimentisphaerales bacterium]|nr:6-carboxytetrahydropterin synthase [Sedimentisphaerales bacterium]
MAALNESRENGMSLEMSGIEYRVSSIEYRDMFTISVETSFWASHQLVLPDGSKEPVHHHNWLVTAGLSSDKLNSMAVVMDFQELKAMVNDIVAEFDNVALNEISYFRQNNPSAENVARYIYEKLRAKLPEGVKLQNIRVVEELGCAANFSESQ